VDVTVDGEVTLQRVVGMVPALMIRDAQMSKLDGREGCRWLRAGRDRDSVETPRP